MQNEPAEITDHEILDTIEPDPAEVRSLFAGEPEPPAVPPPAENPVGPPPAPAGKGGYTVIPDALMARRDLSPAEKLVLARLARYAIRTGVAWPSITNIADAVGMSRRHVIGVVSSLVEVGEITKETRVGYRGVNVYRMAATGAISSLVATGEQSVPTGEQTDTSLVNKTYATGAISSHKDTKKRQSKTKKREHKSASAHVVVFPGILDCEEFKAKWDEYIGYRRQRRLSKLVPSSIKMQLAELASYPLTVAMAAIDKAITKNWNAIYPESVKPAGQVGGPATPVHPSEDYEKIYADENLPWQRSDGNTEKSKPMSDEERDAIIAKGQIPF